MTSALNKQISKISNAYRKRLGRFGEQIATRALSDVGYQVLANNWRYSRLGELDIVALQPEPEATLVFVEVKTRTSQRFGNVTESLGLRQQERMLMLAATFLQAHPQYAHLDQRFDLMCVYPDKISNDPILSESTLEAGLGWRWHHMQNILQSD